MFGRFQMSGRKKGKFGGLVNKVKALREKILHEPEELSKNQPNSWKFGKQESSSTSDQSSVESVSVPQEVANAWGSFIWTPLENYFKNQSSSLSSDTISSESNQLLKDSLPQAQVLGHHLATSEINENVEPSGEKKDFSLKEPKIVSSSNRNLTKSEKKPEAKSFISEEARSEHKRAADFILAHRKEARLKGEMMGTTSPKISSTSTRHSPKSSTEFLKENLAEARQKGEMMGTTSPQLTRHFPVNLHGGNPAATMASDFLNKNLQEARRKGEMMGTTSPTFRYKKNPKAYLMSGPEFLRLSVKEARKRGEQIGTTSPKEKKMKRGSGKKTSERSRSISPKKSEKPVSLPKTEIISGPDFLKKHVKEARKEGERMGTTSPTFKPKTQNVSELMSSAKSDLTGPQFLQKNLNEARKMGEKLGTTSPAFKPKTENVSELMSSAKSDLTGPQFLQKNLNEARKMGEKNGNY